MRYPKPPKRAKAPRRSIRRAKTLGQVRAARKASGPGVDPDTWQAILDLYGGCAYQGTVYSSCAGRIVQDHVEPLARGGRHEPSNVVPACERHNMEKGTQRWTPARRHPYTSEARS